MESLRDLRLVGRASDDYIDPHTISNGDRFEHANSDVYCRSLSHTFPYADQDSASLPILHGDCDLDALSHADEIIASVRDANPIQHTYENAASPTIPNGYRDREALRYPDEEELRAIVLLNGNSDTETIFYADQDTFPDGDSDVETISHADQDVHRHRDFEAH